MFFSFFIVLYSLVFTYISYTSRGDSEKGLSVYKERSTYSFFALIPPHTSVCYDGSFMPCCISEFSPRNAKKKFEKFERVTFRHVLFVFAFSYFVISLFHLVVCSHFDCSVYAYVD